MLYTRIGICIRCGKCCQPPVVTENCCIDKGEDRCKFYIELDNGKLYGHCLIYGRKGEIEKVTDRFGKAITKKQIDWFNHNCINYPLSKDAEKGVYPPPECSFTFEVVHA